MWTGGSKIMLEPYYQTNLGKLYHGDALELFKTIPDNSIDLVLTDPPYGYNNNNNGDLISRWEAALGCGNYIPERDNRPIQNDDVVNTERVFKELVKQSSRVLINGGNICCCCVLVATKGNPCKWYGGNSIPNIISDVPKIIPSSEQHPTEKPIELMKRFIQYHTQKNDIVLDPFMGSGTTAVACELLQRRWIGFEISQEFCELAKKRISKYQTTKSTPISNTVMI